MMFALGSLETPDRMVGEFITAAYGAGNVYTLHDRELRARIDPVLLEHRDGIYRDYLELPVRLA